MTRLQHVNQLVKQTNLDSILISSTPLGLSVDSGDKSPHDLAQQQQTLLTESENQLAVYRATITAAAQVSVAKHTQHLPFQRKHEQQ